MHALLRAIFAEKQKTFIRADARSISSEIGNSTLAM
jgi:hypothetical protein